MWRPQLKHETRVEVTAREESIRLLHYSRNFYNPLMSIEAQA
jgi:hypothetical protein